MAMLTIGAFAKACRLSSNVSCVVADVVES